MKKIKTKLIAFLVIVEAVILLVTAGIGLSSAINIFKGSMNSTFVSLSKQVSSTIESYVQEKHYAVSQLANDSEMKGEDVKFHFTSKMQNLGCSNYALLNYDGSVIYKNTDGMDELAKTDEFKNVVSKSQTAFSFANKLGDGNEYYIMYVPISTNGSVQRVIAAAFPYSEINDKVNTIKFGKNGIAYLMDDKGAILTSKKYSDAIKKVNPIQLESRNSDFKQLSKLHKSILNKTDDYSMFKNNGTMYVASGTYNKALNCYVVIDEPLKDIVSVVPIIIIAVSVAVVMLFITIFLSLRLTKKIVVPIVKSSDRLKELSQGNLSDSVIVTDENNEIGEMTRALDDTITSLRFYVTTISNKLNDIADGDMTDRMHGKFKGDFVKIKSTFNTILLSLIDTFGNINSAAEQVNSGASQVSNGAQALSQGATEQASSIEQLSATILEVSQEIKNNAKSAKNAANIVLQNTSEIGSCNEDMNKMLSAMDQISDASYQISKIIKVIDDIAFQTNILALNAAVEAARAGSAGKGFAVVADEVRNLAEKSAQAAKQTNQLIQDCVDSVNNGTKIAKQTASSLSHIVKSSGQINDLVKTISIASDNQADSIVQINNGIEQISGVVQTNTATAEQSAAASEELSSQSLLLKNMVGKFKLGDKKALFSSADSMVYDRNSGAGASIDFSAGSDDDFAFGGTVSDAKPQQAEDDEFAFGGTVSDSKPQPADDDDEFAFGGTVSDPKPQPADDDEFAFGGTVSDAKPQQADDDEFAFGGTVTDTKPQIADDDEFAFGGSFTDEGQNIDDSDSKY